MEEGLDYSYMPEDATPGDIERGLALEAIAILKVQRFMDRQTQQEGWDMFPNGFTDEDINNMLNNAQ